MTESQFDLELKQNKQAWKYLRPRVRREFAGRFVALAFGRIVASGNRVDQVTAEVHSLDPKPAYFEVFPADEEPMFDVVDSISSELRDE